MKAVQSVVMLMMLGVSFFLIGCNGDDSNSDDTNSSVQETKETNTTSSTGNSQVKGKISVYAKKRTSDSIVAETRVEGHAGIKKITLYCIDAYKYLEHGIVKVISESSKEYNPEKTKIEFYQHTFENLSPQKSYVLKAVAETEDGILHQRTIVATLPLEKLKESIDVSPYDVYHATEAKYTFALPKPTYVDAISIDEYDGDLGTMDVYLQGTDGRIVQIGNNIVTSGDDVNKVTTLSNSDPSLLVKAIIIETDSSLGGMWQINSIVVNP